MDSQFCALDFCRRVQTLRRQYQLSVEQLALLIPLDAALLYRMEEGRLPPEVNAYHLRRLTEVFNVTAEELLHGPG